MVTPRLWGSSYVEQDGAKKDPGKPGLGIGDVQLGQLHAMEGGRIAVVDL